MVAGDIVAASSDASEGLRLAGSLYAQAGSPNQPSAAFASDQKGSPLERWLATTQYFRALLLQAKIRDLLGDASEALAAFKEASLLVSWRTIYKS